MSRTNIHEVPETVSVFERQLNDGSRLEYRMQVLQQPERARACGMGAKSHADRRPVDPPPVVELRLFQGSGADKQDVTFSHNSNFFLFATLEQARPLAQARGMPAPAPAPVLTGVPVSGMAYLDRPSPAGYFIFPDLSVRHEGRYRLRFALYEETKEELFPYPTDPLEPREFCTHRLDVKSKAFTVFSAKKFPGLAESTALSRIVAEQGCRVRIRRDVRMRRRTDRPRGRDSEESLDETAMLRAQRGRTPNQYEVEDQIKAQNGPNSTPISQYHQPAPYMQRSDSADRKRSGSDASVGSMHAAPRYDGYSTPAQGHGPYGAPAAAPPPSNGVNSVSQHLAFGSNGAARQDIAAPPPPPQTDMYNRNGYMSQPLPPQRPQQYPSVNGNGYGSRENSMSMSSQQMQQSPANGHQVRRESVDSFRPRRESDAGYQHYRPGTPSMPPAQYNGQPTNGYSHHQYQQPIQPQTYHSQPPAPPAPQQTSRPPSSSSSNALPPLRLPAMEPKLWNSQPTTPNSSAPPQLPSPAAYPPSTTSQTTQPPPPPPAQPKARAVHAPPPPISAAQVAPTPTPNQFPAYYPDKDNYTTSSSNGYNVTAQPPVPEAGKKRAWGRVFNEAHTEGPMHGGMRPSTGSDVYGADAPPFAVDNSADDDFYDYGKLKMRYRRADGVEIVRKLPGDV